MITKHTEGKAKVFVDNADIPSKDQEVFFNPVMELNRSLSVLLLSSLQEKGPFSIGLPLAGCGIRAVRFFKELDNDHIKHIYCNDNNSDAVALINKNLQHNKCPEEKYTVSNLEANMFFEQSCGFDYIDIDPFGSPNFLLESSIRRLSRKGILAVTATDTGALAGTYRGACRQKYWASPLLCPQKHELGLRILIRKVMLMGMHQGRALTPIVTYHHQHYYRVFFRVKKGKIAAQKLFFQTNKLYHYCPSCSFQKTSEDTITACPSCGHKLSRAGPLYSGLLQDKTVLDLMKEKTTSKQIKKLLAQLSTESKVDVVGSYDSHEMCQQRKCRVKTLTYYISALQKQNFQAVVCATNNLAFKTNAPFDIVDNLFERKNKKK